MVLDKRRAHLLSIIQQSTDPVPPKELAAKMNCRSVRSITILIRSIAG